MSQKHTSLQNELSHTADPAVHAAADEHEFELLQVLSRQAEGKPRQRDLAQALGMSLGMTNSILKRLAGKGLVTLRKIDGRTIQYVVTPEGTRALASRSYRYMRRTIGNVVRWKEQIDSLVRNAKLKGSHGIVLCGQSDLDFIVEHCCTRHGLSYRSHCEADPETLDRLNPASCLLAGEHIDPQGSQAEKMIAHAASTGTAEPVFLRDVL
ncbi:winged helix-turn-helix transcriptional regulator [Spirochaeta dissipatitropha]